MFDACAELDVLPDILINNAGFGGQGDVARERDMESDLSMIAVNIEAPTRLLKLFLPEVIERGSGQVLNVSSTAALTPGPLQAVYYATKAYVTSWSNALWRECQGTGVTVSCLMPGGMLKGQINIVSGLVYWQKPFVTMTPLMPRKRLLDFAYDQQVSGKSA